MTEVLSCDRKSMCEFCTKIDHDRLGQKDVCIAVGVIATRPDVISLNEEAISDLAYDIMAGIADDDDYVTIEMKNAAIQSTKELILERII